MEITIKSIKTWFICKRYSIKNWTLNEETGLVDVVGSVGLSYEKLTELPLNFGNVKGDFWCYGNNLTTLKGAPHSVGGYFNCGNNKISTRQKLPNVGYIISCDKNMKWIF